MSLPLALAQMPQYRLDKDPVFIAIASRRINYPPILANNAIYGRVYAGFEIDERGRIQHITLLYPVLSQLDNRSYGFEYEIKNGLKHMPPLNPKYVGSYMLPIAFCFTHHREGPNPIIPTNILPHGYYVGNRKVLSEIKIFSQSPTASLKLNVFPPSRPLIE
jgi:hypothetical protein